MSGSTLREQAQRPPQQLYPLHTPQTPPRERLASSASIASMSSTLRGRRAPAPLDLSPGKEKYGSVGLGQVPASAPSRRVVTEPATSDRASRPLPRPPNSQSGSFQSPLAPAFAPTSASTSYSALTTDDGSVSLNTYNASPNPSDVVNSPQPDPSNIDRQALIGVGELATPRWGSSAHHNRISSMSATLPDPSWPPGYEGFGLGLEPSRPSSRNNSGPSVPPPPRPPPKSPARDSSTKDEPLFSLNTLADFNFDSSMEAALVASLAMPHQELQASPSDAFVTSPGSARSRIYARRQERADAAAAAAARTGQKTPPTRHSSHDILKQFAVKDFSHLPPSPSSASINQFLRGSGSSNNLTTPPTSAGASSTYFKSNQTSDSQRRAKAPVDVATAEALRKLDGLSVTPGKGKPKMKLARSGTPPSAKPPKLQGKPSNGSMRDVTSPWIDIGEDLPAVPLPRQHRESSSSTSFVGTPTSRDSHSIPTTATTPSSGDLKPSRRSSAGSDISAIVNDPAADTPPVPPIPRGYQSRLQEAAPRINKKWSFSSALNIKAPSPDEPPQTPWSEIQRAELSPQAPTPLAVKPTSASKRLTPSSIPFFRRTSSSSTQSTIETPKVETRPNLGSQRKSVLGMHFPSMLRGSTSKRGLAQHAESKPESNAEPKPQPASTGWTGRRRGKTLSISADPPAAPVLKSAPPLKSKASTESFNRASAASSAASTINGGLPAIIGSPILRPVPSTSSLRHSESSRQLPSATPTKIPRIASRPGPGGSMPPPQSTQRSTITTTTSLADLSRPPVSEFGVVEDGAGPPPRQSTTGAHAHRAHLLAPIASRQASKVRSSEPPKRDPTMPPSRRQLPQPPSTVTAMTVSATAKRASRDMKSSRDSSGDSRTNSPMKPSKSLHSKLSVASASRMPLSSSMGAPGMTFRSSSLVADTPSPAEDEEALGDAEMAAYVQRRRAKAAADRKDDLVDINEFPEDIAPNEAMSQRSFVSRHLGTMSDYERKEVLDFDRIYYAPSPTIRPPQPGGAVYNYGYDDERGDYLVVPGDHMCYRYEVVGLLGKGSFGQVIQCRDHQTGGSVAIKIIRNKKRFHAQALVEVKILQQLMEWDPEDKHFNVRMTDHFYFRGHLCIVTELLSINLYELIKANQFAGFSTVLIRRFTTQMLASLQLMRSHRVVHCDLKPENILLCHPARSGIKVIDFGSSCLETEKVYTYIQSRFYRSPEVILGMNYAMAIDMWSVGCILAELYTGVPIFPGENEHEQLACIMEVLGVPEKYIIDKASRKRLFFDATGTPRPFVNAKGRRRRPGTKTLAQVLKCDDELFVDFIAKCLTWDPDKRLKPQPAMRHPWILAGRKRYAPTPVREEKRPPTVKSSSKLLISPPTPLTARQTSHKTTRLAHIRNPSYTLTPRVG